MGNANTFKYAKITRHSAASPIEVTKVGGDDDAAQKPEAKKSLAQNQDDPENPHPDSQPPMPKDAAVQVEQQDTVARTNAPTEEAFV